MATTDTSTTATPAGSNSATTPAVPAPKPPQNESQVMAIIKWSVLGGLIMLLLINMSNFWFSEKNQLAKMLTGFGYMLLVGGACYGLGALTGFLFGIPRLLENNSADKSSVSRLVQNDNLVQISDWLTKIIVGVGLTQISSLYPGLLDVGKDMASSFSENAILGRNLAIGTILYFTIIGFLSGYLWTRIHFYPLLAQTSKDVDKLQQQVAEAEKAKEAAVAQKDEAELQRIAMEEEKRKAEAEMEEVKKSQERKQRELQALSELTKADPMLKTESLFISDNSGDDPNAGKFGGLAEVNGRRLQANVGESSFDPNRFFVELEVVSTDSNKPLEGDVKIFLHPATFNPPERVLTVLNGSVHLDLFAWGSFTVGAVCDGGETKLELNLSKIPGVPEKFAKR
jgi:hypothetical protein